MAAKILVVDDEPQFERLILQRFRRQAREGKYEFLFAQNGVEALDVLARNTGIDMVLTDINMPKMDGISFIQEIREDPLLKDAVIFVFTTSKAETDQKAAYNLNVAGYVVKTQLPNGFDELMNMLGWYIRIVEFTT